MSNEKDCFRFVHDLYEFNDENLVLKSAHYYQKYQEPAGIVKKRKRILLVDIIAWTLMPNHYHLLLRQLRNDGVSLFMQKLAGGYTGYFNTKYERSGVLFQGKYKIKAVTEDRYLRHLVTYVHTNAADLFVPGWKEHGIKKLEPVLRQLKEYRWSSYQDYIGEKNFPSLLGLDAIHEFGLPTGKTQEGAVRSWIAGAAKTEAQIRQLTIEN